jgi:hypothetical protein
MSIHDGMQPPIGSKVTWKRAQRPGRLALAPGGRKWTGC